MNKNLLLLIIVVLGFTSVSAKNYIAAVNGTSAGTGTLDSPYDIPTAISIAIAGDTVYIRGGHYMLNAQISLSKGGTATEYLSIFAYPGDERPVLDFYNRGYSGTNSSGERGIQVSQDYYYVYGLDITCAGDNGMHIKSSHNKIQNCRFYKNCDGGLQITGGTGAYNEVIDCDSYENFDYKTSNAGGNADGFSCKLTVGVGNKFIRCRSWNNSDDGYDCYETQNDIYFEDCWVMTNGQKSYDVTDYPGGTTGVINNLGNGNGFKVGGLSSPGGATLIRCISIGHKILSTSKKGFDQNNGVGRVFCYNCISYNDGIGYSFPNNRDARGANTFANNISLFSGGNSFGPGTASQTNTWNGIPVSIADFESVAVDSSKVARNADGSLPYMGGLFRLIENSGLIDKGTDVALPFSGSAPDLGPFEYGFFTSLPLASADLSDISMKYYPGSKEIIIQGLVSFVEVFQITGVKIYSRHISASRLNIQANNWPKGIYIIRVYSQNGALSVKKMLIN
ncbi:MAG: T9SS type A sorting domain-containing protein [Bacteroidales bacterium]|nr:T9SS type A sorting domain-containing protein [Bacteroidales bacterium]